MFSILLLLYYNIKINFHLNINLFLTAEPGLACIKLLNWTLSEDRWYKVSKIKSL